MNIKTTIVLVILLLGVGAYVFFTRDKGVTETKTEAKTLLDVKRDDVTRVVIAGPHNTIEAKKDGSNWKLVQPVAAPADKSKVEALLDSLTEIKSVSQIAGGNAANMGLSKPGYTVDLYVGDKDHKIAIGDRLPTSDGVYAKVDAQDKIDVLPSSVMSTLGQPADDLRKTKVFDTDPNSVQQMTITKPDGSKIVLQKRWEIVTPTGIPADQTAIEGLVNNVVGVQANSFVDDSNASDQNKKHVATVTFSTQTTTGNQAPTDDSTTLHLNGYENIDKQNVIAQEPDGTLITVPASLLDSVTQKPDALRDKAVINIDPQNVTKLTISVNRPATTQPTTMPAEARTTVLLHQHGPTTSPAAGQSAAEWVVSGLKPIDADASRVISLLNQFHPMTVDSYLSEKPPGTKFAAQYIVTIATKNDPNPLVLTLTDPGNESPLFGAYNGLSFMVPRTIATDLGATDFTKPATPPALPGMQGMPSGMPPGFSMPPRGR